MAFGVTMYTGAGMGVFGYTAYINTQTNDISGMIAAIVLSLAAGAAAFILTYITYKDDAPAAPAKKTAEITAAADSSIAAPVSGKVMDLSETPDEVFASGALGQGVAIEPAEGKVYAPCDGTVTTFASTCHAIGLTSDTGVEILIHVGMDTVDMNGDGFSPKKKEGDSVKKGELLLEFDMEKIRSAGLLHSYAVRKGLPGEGHGLNGLDFFAAYDAGEPEAIQTLKEFGKQAAAGIYSIQAVLDLPRFAIGDGISARPEVTQVIRTSLDTLFSVFPYTPFKKPEIVTCRYGNDANLIGALRFHIGF